MKDNFRPVNFVRNPQKLRNKKLKTDMFSMKLYLSGQLESVPSLALCSVILYKFWGRKTMAGGIYDTFIVIQPEETLKFH